MTAGGTPSPSAEGDLARTPFAHLLVYVVQQNLSGTLVLWVDGVDSRILLQNGHPVALRLREGRPTTVRAGLLPFFPVASAPYAYYANVNLLGEGPEIVTGTVDPYSLLTAALRGDTREDAIDNVLARFGTGLVRMTPGFDLKRFELSQQERGLVEFLRAEPASIDTLIHGSGLPANTARRIVYLLLVTKAVEQFDASKVKVPVQAPPLSPPEPRQAVAPAPQAPQAQQPNAPAQQPSPGAFTPKAPVRNDLPKPPATLSANLREQWEAIVHKASAMDKQNYFEMLGIPTDAGATRARDAYFELAKKWHPDRLAPELAPLVPTAQVIFRTLSEAHDTLANDEKRAQYIRIVKDGGGTPEADRKMMAILEAAMEFQKAEVLMKRRDFEGALALVKTALALNDEDPDYHGTYGWLLFQIHQGPDAPISEILASLEKALRQNEKNDRTHFYKGMVLKRIGRGDEALRHFKTASDLNPRNTDAVREVRIASMRGKNPTPAAPSLRPGASGASMRPKPKSSPPAGGGGLFSKLLSNKKK